MKKPIQIKVDDADLTSWNEQAENAGMSLSAWIRKRCNGANGNDQPVRSTCSPSLAEQRTGIPDRVTEPAREPSGFSAIEIEVAKRTGHEPGHDCFQCTQTFRFVKSTMPEPEPEPAKKAKKR